MSGRKLYIHIGSHKTGTTSIQHALRDSAEQLLNNGLVFFYQKQNETDWEGYPDLHNWIETVEFERVVPKGARLANPRHLVSLLSNYEQDIVVSSENFSFFFEKEYIEELYSSVSKIFDDIVIICYLRRQDQHIISHAQEGSKLLRELEGDLWGNSANSLPAYNNRFDYYLDYNRRIGMWMDTFGDDAVKVRCFERSRLKGGDVLVDFFSLLGVDDFSCVDARNVTKTSTRTKLHNIIIDAGIKNREKLFSFVNSLSLPERKMLPGREEAGAFYKHYQEGNSLLASRLGETEFSEFFSSDFSDYPEISTDTWGAHETNFILRSIFTSLGSGLLGLTVPDLLLAAESCLQAEKYGAAMRFTEAARAINPNNKRVKGMQEKIRNEKTEKFGR